MTPKAALMELAAIYARWRKRALSRAATDKEQGNEAEARFHQGRAHAFDDAAIAASRSADAFEEAGVPSEARQQFWESLNVGLEARFELTIERNGDEWKICHIGYQPDVVSVGKGNSFAEAWANRSVAFDGSTGNDPSDAHASY